MDLKITQDERGVTFAVKIMPRAARDEIVGVANDALVLRLHAPPVEGRANRALIEFLAQVFDVARSQIEIIRGESARFKLIRVRGVSREGVEKKLTK